MKKMLKPFESPVIQAFIVVLLFILVIAITTYPKKSINTENNDIEEVTNNVSATFEEASNRAQQHLVGRMDSIRPEDQLIVDYLQRKFELNNKLSTEVHAIDLSNSTDPGLRTELEALSRIAYPDKRVSGVSSNSTLLAIAGNCDYIPIPADYTARIQQDIDAGSYEVTHAALSLRILEELGCDLVDREALLAQAAMKVRETADEQGTISDLRYEAIAVLQYIGRGDLVTRSDLETIMKEQLENGGWSYDKNGNDLSNDHATAFALWALLEYEHPHKVEPMMRKVL